MLPAGLMWLRDDPAGAGWLESLPRLVEACAKRWSLRVGEAYPDSYVALVLPAEMADGTDAVLKIQFPDHESEHEAEALRKWNGAGAIRLFDYDPQRRALLLERCSPGTHLGEREPEEALGVLIDLLPRLWKPATEPFRPLAKEAQRWAHQLPNRWDAAGQPFERDLVDTAIDLLDDLAASQGEQVLLHQDLHADNVLRAQREPWLVIDPKPLVGEREFSAAPIARSYELGHTPTLVSHRLDRVTSDLGLDRARARDWTIAQTLSWAFERDRVLPRHLDTARWLLQER